MGELINGRTPEEIKRELRWAMFKCGSINCEDCEYYESICSHTTEQRLAPDALALIERLESERDAALAKVPKWISVEERLPEDDGDYIALIALHQKPTDYTLSQPWFVSRVYYRKKVGFHWHSGTVTHWMHLPEPQKEETI